MRFILLTAIKDLRRVLRDPTGLLTWIAMPAVITGLVSLISTGPQPIPQGTLLVVDNDQSIVSRLLTAPFGRQPLDKMVRVERTDYDAGKKRIDAGEASALLEIPKGYGNAYLHGEHSQIKLTVNPSQRIMPKVIEEVLSGSLDAGFYAQAAFAPRLAALSKNPAADTTAQLAATLEQVAQRAGASDRAPLISLETTVTGESPKPQSMPALFFPGMMILAVFGLGQSLSVDWWAERTQGTLRRAIASPQTLLSFLAGKTTALGLLSLGLAIIGMATAKWVIKAPSENFLLASVWIAASGVALYLMNSLFHMMAGDQRGGLVLNQLALFVLSMLGGSFIPFKMMPDWLANIGRMTPNGFAVAQFKAMADGVISSKTALGFLYLGLFTLAEMYLLLRSLRKWAV